MGMTVGTAATTAGVSAKAVRLWESKGLLPPAERTEAGYRVFTDDDLDVLRFIRQAKTLGLTLPEIKNIIDLQRDGVTPCGRVTELLDTHIAEIDRTLADLVTAEEGCLSLPDVIVDVERPLHARLTGVDVEGAPMRLEASGLEARVLQHELDHLDGVLMTERMDPDTRKRALKEIRRMRERIDGPREPASFFS